MEGSTAMARTSFVVVLIALFAGAAAGMAIQLMSAKEPAPVDRPTAQAAAEVRQDEVLDAIARLDNEVEKLRLEVDTLATRNDELEKELAEARKALKAAPAPIFSEDGHTVDLGKAMKGRGVPAGGHFFFGGKSKPGYKIASLPEDEKWEKLREDLSLDSYQEEQLKEIAKDYRDSFKDLFKPDENGKLTLGKLDLGKIMKAKNDADERVKNLFSEQQYKKYKDGGYGAAIGLGGGNATVSVSTSFGSSEGK
jgi:hypothetical protein